MIHFKGGPLDGKTRPGELLGCNYETLTRIKPRVGFDRQFVYHIYQWNNWNEDGSETDAVYDYSYVLNEEYAEVRVNMDGLEEEIFFGGSRSGKKLKIMADAKKINAYLAKYADLVVQEEADEPIVVMKSQLQEGVYEQAIR